MPSSLLPPNASALDRAAEAVITDRLEAIAQPHRALWNPNTCPVALLPWLAWALSVDEWDAEWPEARQREAVLTAVELNRKRGTPWAVLRALAVHGFPDCEIIEYAAFLKEWQASGGKYLDGSWQLSGQLLAPNVPGARDVVRNSALNHWAHYAIRVNSADVSWSLAQQQKLAQVAQRYAPARSHLVALIEIVRAGFAAAIQMTPPRQKIRTRFAGCTRITATGHVHLDGCWLLDGSKTVLSLDGSATLRGQPLAASYDGQLLDSANLTFRNRMRLRAGFHATGGQRLLTPRRLGWDWRALDGAWQLDNNQLAGWPLSSRQPMNAAQFDQLESLGNRLDGSWPLGSLGEDETSIWAHGRITMRSRGLVTTEAL